MILHRCRWIESVGLFSGLASAAMGAPVQEKMQTRPAMEHTRQAWFIYFYIFYFRFLQKYIFVFEICRNIPRPPRCRAAGT